MIPDERKPHLRKIWAEHKPSQWHTLIGTSISREEWLYLCDMWAKHQKPLKSNPTASTNTPGIAEEDIKRLTEALG